MLPITTENYLSLDENKCVYSYSTALTVEVGCNENKPNISLKIILKCLLIQHLIIYTWNQKLFYGI